MRAYRRMRYCGLVLLLAGASQVAAQTDSSANSASLHSGVHGFGYEMPSVTNYEITKAVGIGMEALRQKWFASVRMQQPVDAAGTAIIECRITRQGTIEKVKVVQSSADTTLDGAASTLLSEATFTNLPRGFKGTELRAVFPFNLPSLQDRPACSSLALTPAKKVGKGVSPPGTVYQPDPEYTDQARRSKYQGEMLLGLTVTPEGSASEVCVLQGLGMGLDEKAVEAVKSWKFKPSLENGVPVPVRIAVEVSFALY